MLSRTALRTLNRTASSLMAKNAQAPSVVAGARFMGTLEESPSAQSAWQKSCYYEMDFSISEESSVHEAVQRFAAYDIGCLVTTDAEGRCHYSCSC